MARAEALLRQASEAFPGRVDIPTLLGRVAWSTGRQAEACAIWRQACARDPRAPEPAAWLAEGLLETGSAAAAADLAKRITASGWRNPMPWSTLIRAQRQLGQAQEAVTAAIQACEAFPGDGGLLYCGCVVAQENGHHRLVAGLAERLLAIDPGHAGAAAMQVDAHSRTSRWDDLPAATARMEGHIRAGGSEPGLLDAAFAWDDPERMAAVTAAVATALPACAPRPRPRPPHGDGRIRICYLSPDFREHPVARALLPIMERHDRARFQIMTAGLGPRAAAGPGAEVIALSEFHLDLGSLSDQAAADALRAAGVDVLVDLAGATTRNRYGILASRPAPTQVLWLGCATGTGAGWYDAYLLDGIVAPMGSHGHLREPVVRLPGCYHPIPFHEQASAVDRAEFAIPDDAILIACPHAPHKARPPVVEAWLRIIARTQGTILWLDAIDDQARAAITAFAAARDVSADRLRFWPFQADRGRYLGVLRLADLFLDGHPYGAHSTAGEAIAVGVPVLTPSGRCSHARVAASMLSATGLGHGICDGMADLTERAERLCRDRSALADLRRQAGAARQGLPAIMDGLRTALESTYAGLAGRRA